MDQSIQISTEHVRSALQCWNMTKQLGKNELTKLKGVTQYHRMSGYSYSDAGYGMALRHCLQETIETIRPEGEIDPTNKTWRPYLAVTHHFISGEHRDMVMAHLHIARRTFYQAINQAIEAITDQLYVIEEKNHISSHRIIESSTPFLTFVPPLPVQPIALHPEAITQIKSMLLTGHDVGCTGLPGIGKTTLCAYIAHDEDIQAQYPDGILWAGLGGKPDVMALLGEWAIALGIDSIELQQARTIVDRTRLIHHTIGKKRILLIIDDAWDIDPVFVLQVGGHGCAHLVTSRHKFVALDFTVNHQPLTVLSETTSTQFLHNIAPTLLECTPQIARTLTMRVGGLPLALMLIGRHIRKHGATETEINQLIKQLESAETRLTLSQSQNPLHRRPDLSDQSTVSLHSVIKLSYDRLDQAEQQALCDLTVFPPRPNTFSLEGALAITNQPDDIFQNLVAKGLVDTLGNNRYAIHQTISDFASLQQNNEQIQASTIERFFNWSTRPVDIPLKSEYRNWQKAMQYALDRAEPLIGFRLLDAFGLFFPSHGLLEEQSDYLQQLHQLATSMEGKSAEIALAHIEGLIGSNYIAQRDYKPARSHLEKSLHFSQKHELLERQQKTISVLGHVCRRLGQFDDSERYCLQGLALCDQSKHQKNRIHLFNNLSSLSSLRGHYLSAQTYFEDALKLSKACNLPEAIAIIRNNRAWMMTRLGNHDALLDAVAEYQDTLDQMQTIDHVGIKCLIRNGMALAHCRLGNWEMARHNSDEAFTLLAETAGELNVRTQHIRGRIATTWHQYDDATELYQGAIDEAEARGDTLERIALYNQMSHLARLQGQFDAATTYAQTVLDMTEMMDIPPARATALYHLGTVQAATDHLAQAKITLQQAFSIFDALALPHFALPIQVQLAYCATMFGDTAGALHHLRPILDYDRLGGLTAVPDRFNLYVIAHDLLVACGKNQQAAALLKSAQAHLCTHSEKITDQQARSIYLNGATAIKLMKLGS